MLSELEKEGLDATLGLFRDDGFGASNATCQEIEDMKKLSVKYSENMGYKSQQMPTKNEPSS